MIGYAALVLIIFVGSPGPFANIVPSLDETDAVAASGAGMEVSVQMPSGYCITDLSVIPSPVVRAGFTIDLGSPDRIALFLKELATVLVGAGLGWATRANSRAFAGREWCSGWRRMAVALPPLAGGLIAFLVLSQFESRAEGAWGTGGFVAGTVDTTAQTLAAAFLVTCLAAGLHWIWKVLKRRRA